MRLFWIIKIKIRHRKLLIYPMVILGRRKM
jgi:hypothetical protein